jgi:hypothetical protein
LRHPHRARSPQPGKRDAIGLDVGLKHDRTVAAVVYGERLLAGDGAGTVGVRVVLDRMEVWQGSRRRPVRLRAVEERLAEASRAYDRAAIRFDPWQAVGLAQRLQARRVRTLE